MLQLQIPLGNTLPISLVLLSHLGQGRVVFIKTGTLSCVIDLNKDGSSNVIFAQDGFSIGEEEFSYAVAYDYKNIPEMLKWLQQQNLQWPAGVIF